jgi:MoxR-like ATPase
MEAGVVGLFSRVRNRGMTLDRLLAQTNFEPDEIAILNRAFEDVLRSLGLVDRNDPLTEIVARTIIDLAERGLRDPDKISEVALKELRS